MNPPPPTLHLVTPADLEATAHLFDAQLREHGITVTPDGLRESMRAVITQPQHGFILLATVDHQPVGVAYAATIHSLEHGGIIGWLEELYVLPGHRNTGIGTALLQEVISRGLHLGWKGLELEIIHGHDRVAALYLRHGFHPLPRNRFCHLFPPRP